jgi:hypothetical protein
MFSPETPTPTATRQTTGGTPRPPTYGAEACLPLGAILGPSRVQTFDRFIKE